MLKERLSTWLSSPALGIFATVTLKQALLTAGGSWCRISHEDIRKTGWLLRDRLTKRLIGPAAFKQGKQLPFLVFKEGDGKEKRFHLHIVAAKPLDTPLQNYVVQFEEVAHRLDWVHDQIDIRQLNSSSPDRGIHAIKYSLKEGLDAFLIEASFVPQH